MLDPKFFSDEKEYQETFTSAVAKGYLKGGYGVDTQITPEGQTAVQLHEAGITPPSPLNAETYEILRILQFSNTDKTTDNFAKSTFQNSLILISPLQITTLLIGLIIQGFVKIDEDKNYSITDKGIAAFDLHTSGQVLAGSVNKPKINNDAQPKAFEINDTPSKEMTSTGTHTPIQKKKPWFNKRAFNWLRPVNVCRKYYLAAKLLDIVAGNHVEVLSVNDKETFIPVEPLNYELGNYFRLNPKVNKYLALYAVNFLVDSGDVKKIGHENAYKIILQPTEKGKVSYREGLYYKKTAKEIKAILLIILSALSLIAAIVFRQNILELLQDLFHKPTRK